MGVDLELDATRLITVNKTGKVEIQSYSIEVVNLSREICVQIVDSKEPYKEYCKNIKLQYSELEPIYIWDKEELYGMPEIVEREELCKAYGPQPEDIIGYKTYAEDIICFLDTNIKDALDNGYKLNWTMSY